MIRQVFVADTTLSADQVYHQASLEEITLIIGMDRIPTPGHDLTALTEAAAIADKLERVVHAYRRDLEVRIGQLKRAVEQRATAAALCVCGAPTAQGVVHQTGAPCHADESHVHGPAILDPAGIGELDDRLGRVVERVFNAPADEAVA
ncbi:hypothetical protein [Streptosporangium saharense]|uniref:Uncharacterized protein n=1 Tax=Streptosporangium saharense TaxID=1706840 RepID=A0A7W7QK44_9ACTN|nr:hypothetical protein [Streptosporangium saharense]MBB4915067.1 hypothetical protein [Streptosporangium saharense]